MAGLFGSDEGSIPSEGDRRVENNTVRHKYRVLQEQEKQAVLHFKDLGLEFIEFCDRMGSSRELSLAKTKVEEAVMWAVKHVTN